MDKIRNFVIFAQTRRLFLEFRRYILTTQSTFWHDYVHRRFRYHDTTRGECATAFSDQSSDPHAFFFQSVSPAPSSALFHIRTKSWEETSLSSEPRRREYNFCWEVHLAREIIYKHSVSTFFDWTNGSRLIFWRWPKESRAFVTHGAPPYTWTNPPNFQRKARALPQEDKMKAWEKLKKYIQRGYLVLVSCAFIQSFINYFLVPKGPNDKRFVLSATNCGLNPSVWVPSFWMPFSSTMTRLLHYGWKVVDIDLGEMFLNFHLHRLLIPYSGVDLTQFRDELKTEFPEYADKLEDRIGSVFNVTFFGYRASPINAAKAFYLAEEILRGNPNDPANILKWDCIILNMLGDSTYNPALPNVYKWCSKRKQMAPDMTAFVDDLRALGLSYEQAWKVARQIASRLQYLGIQDAPRKRRLDNGPWAGGVYGTDNGQITKTVTNEKWNKGKRYLREIREEIADSPDNSVSFKKVESVRGFLCHLAMVYDIFFPYLKGFHLLLAEHLPKRMEGGWKMKDSEWIGYIQGKVEAGEISPEEAQSILHSENTEGIQPPERLIPSQPFLDSMEAFETFMKEDTPPSVVVRQSKAILLMYGFLDASGSGFGSSTLVQNDVHYRIGTWKEEETDNSSNWKEFTNLVSDVKEAGKKGWLTGNTMVLATDNETVEKVIYKGNSTSRKLFELVLELRQLELKYGARLIVSHVAGTRMIAQGTDGLSRGNIKEGVSLGIKMLTFCPWNKNALEVQPKLKPWLQTWIGNEAKFLEPKDWFIQGHDIEGFERNGPFWTPKIKSGIYIWTPAPAAADVALEQLRIARIKRQKSTHLVIIPRLLTSQWLKQLYKAADLVVFCPAIHDFWNKTNFENLTFAFVFPFLEYRPFQQRKTPKMFGMGRQLSQMFKQETMADWDLLRKFWRLHQQLPTLPRSVVWELLYYGKKLPFPRGFRKRNFTTLGGNNESNRRTDGTFGDSRRATKKLRSK